jgi:hypothetical protein
MAKKHNVTPFAGVEKVKPAAGLKATKLAQLRQLVKDRSHAPLNAFKKTVLEVHNICPDNGVQVSFADTVTWIDADMLEPVST